MVRSMKDAPIALNGSLVRRIKIWCDGPLKMPQVSMTLAITFETLDLLTSFWHVSSSLCYLGQV